MARNSSGTHSLPSGNPVVSGASISSTTNNNTMSDISSEITDSLSRSGKGAMLAPLELANGTVALPALSFDSDTDTGVYRKSANTPAMAAGGAESQEWSATGTTVPGTLAVTGATTLTGAATLSSTLAVTGASTLTGAVTCAAGVTANQSASNTDAIAATGNGTGDGIQATSSGGGAGGRFSSTSGNAVDIGTGNAKLSASNPASSTGFSNTITPINVAKAWGTILVNAGTPSITDGFNITSVAVVTNGLQITLTTAMADANYAVIPNDTNGVRRPGGSALSASVVRIVAVDDAGSTVNYGAVSAVVHFVIYGRQ